MQSTDITLSKTDKKIRQSIRTIYKGFLWAGAALSITIESIETNLSHNIKLHSYNRISKIPPGQFLRSLNKNMTTRLFSGKDDLLKMTKLINHRKYNLVDDESFIIKLCKELHCLTTELLVVSVTTSTNTFLCSSTECECSSNNMNTITNYSTRLN